MNSTSKLRLAFYGDDFTGSTDALEQLTLAGCRCILFLEPPTPAQLAKFKNLQAIGIAGMTRSLPTAAMERVLRPAYEKIKALGPRHVHYKVCSTFDSSPKTGSIGRVIDIAETVFPARFVPLVVAAPALGRYCVFGNLFARFGIGSDGAIHRLDRHPSISRHPITPMREADLRLHLAKQMRGRIELFDVLKLRLPFKKARSILSKMASDGARVVLFDVLSESELEMIGRLIDKQASGGNSLFSVGSSGIEMALTAHWNRGSKRVVKLRKASAVNQLLVGSGSCSPVTLQQIQYAVANGFAEVALDANGIADAKVEALISAAVSKTIKFLRAGRSVIVHTTRGGSDRKLAAKLKGRSAEILGSALGKILRDTIEQHGVQRLCVAGGDTSSFAARALGIEALEMIAPLTPGAPLCRAIAPGTALDGLELVFKGGQVGAENYFECVKAGTDLNRRTRRERT
ncbi:MAG TPA: four-carbon acid sugar kinase family protein [Verrucomicrobiae bacterium]|nr:four-carbon acid sugar kinase family protein [Verrucomicrobiae bacterium]